MTPETNKEDWYESYGWSTPAAVAPAPVPTTSSKEHTPRTPRGEASTQHSIPSELDRDMDADHNFDRSTERETERSEIPHGTDDPQTSRADRHETPLRHTKHHDESADRHADRNATRNRSQRTRNDDRNADRHKVRCTEEVDEDGEPIESSDEEFEEAKGDPPAKRLYVVEFGNMARGRPKSNLSRDEKLAKKREAERERRARRKADEELRKEDQLKEQMRWSKVQCAKFSVLEHQMDPSSNFSSYRSTLKAAVWRSAAATDDSQRIVIPFFSLLVKDLYFLNEGCSNKLPNGHINFEKFWQLAKQVTEFITWKQVHCPFPKAAKVITYLQATPVLNEDALALASFECEPPENHEKDRYKSLKAELEKSGSN
ncbi:hypothetical protein GE061_014115 [Apolygus lucorum]|uniref:Ras-GEF domain-containing protein n=1 Tax=Apolygus lucorum TaxID=248454 RepID=A0A8S9XPL7_APOLU|nr:hypothetical protein GE061_014115 [Apolygus lucorum]